MQAMVMSVGGLVIAFVIGWKFAFVVLGIFPFIMIGIVIMAMCTMSKGKSSYYNKAGAYAEQALALIRVVIAFG